MQFKSAEAHDAYQILITTTLSKDSIESLRMAQEFSSIVEHYIEYYTESDYYISKGIKIALSNVIKKYGINNSNFYFAKLYLERFWKYHYKVVNFDELLSDLLDDDSLLINI